MSEHILKVPDYNPLYDPAVQWASLGEEIVRCRDCRHCVIYETWNPKGETYHCNSFGQDIDPDGFCAWGERK